MIVLQRVSSVINMFVQAWIYNMEKVEGRNFP